MVGEEKRKSAADLRRVLSRFTEQVQRKNDLVLGERIAEVRLAPDVPDVLADYARLYDLSIVPMWEGNHVAQFNAQWHLQTIVFGFGHPTIIVPSEGSREKAVALDTIIVAWDGGAERQRVPSPMHCPSCLSASRCACWRSLVRRRSGFRKQASRFPVILLFRASTSSLIA